MSRRVGPALLLALALAGAPAQAREDGADGTIGPDAFKTLTTGRTLTFTLDGRYYGAEQYLPERKVIWRLGNGDCVVGEWFPRNDSICFTYDAIAGLQCWRFTRRQGQLHASSLAGDMDLKVTGNSDQPLACSGPDMGV